MIIIKIYRIYKRRRRRRRQQQQNTEKKVEYCYFFSCHEYKTNKNTHGERGDKIQQQQQQSNISQSVRDIAKPAKK